uniref:MHC class I-like antigen recognition-like domain-containing protein n=1 Tax=Naja naja TaxID=35670 RepID=A0A8C6Y2B5_NAJNA
MLLCPSVAPSFHPLLLLSLPSSPPSFPPSTSYFCTAISDPSHGLPHFVALGYVDGQIFSYYDNVGQRMKPLVPWIEKAGQEDPQYWERNTRSFRARQELFRGHLENLKTLYNQSEGLHIWQLIYGCELQADGSKRGFYQFGYEGRTLITFNMETLTWVAPDPLAQFTQKKWDAIPELNQRTKAYLGEVCIEWLERYLSYGKETLISSKLPPPHLQEHPLTPQRAQIIIFSCDLLLFSHLDNLSPWVELFPSGLLDSTPPVLAK